MNRAPGIKTLTQSTFEQLCRQACSNPPPQQREETVDDAYWRSICLEVSRHLNAPLFFRPSEGGSRGHIYRITLLEMVDGKLRGSFDPVAVANDFIDVASGSEGNPEIRDED